MGHMGHLADYLKRNSHIFDTKPKFHSISELGCNILGWKATRLVFKRNGIQKITNPTQILAIYIKPNSKKGGYQEGFFIAELKELQQTNQYFQARMRTKSFLEKGLYSWPCPPKEMNEHFYPL
jgi:hypothetical protein